MAYVPIIYDDPSAEVIIPDGYLLIQLRQTIAPGHALSEPEPSMMAAAIAPTGLGFEPVIRRPSSGGFASLGLVSGATTSRLDEVRGFDDQNPYVVGEFGVTANEDGFVEYVLDEITYRTELATGITQYRFGYVDPVQAGLMNPRHLLGRDEVMYHERRPVVNSISIQRNDQPVLIDFYAVARATSLDQLPEPV